MGPIAISRASRRGISRRVAVRALLAFGMLATVTACAADSLRPLPNQSLEAILSRGAVGEVQIALEPYETDTKTMSILDKRFISEGVLPVLVVLVNGGNVVYEINPHEIFLIDPVGKHSAAATAAHVGKTAGKSELSPGSREAVAGAAGILGPIALPLFPLYIADESAQAHNQSLAREYLAMGLPHYIPRGETRGLVFFQIPKGEAIGLDGYRVRFQKVGPRGTTEQGQVEIPLVGP